MKDTIKRPNADAAPPLKRLWPWYSVEYAKLFGGDFCEVPARSQAHAKAVAFRRHGCPGFRVTNVELAWWNPHNRAMMGLRSPKERVAS